MDQTGYSMIESNESNDSDGNSARQNDYCAWLSGNNTIRMRG